MHVPEVAHGGMAIADVRHVGPDDDPLGRTRLAGDDQIVGAQVKLLQCQRHQGQIVAKTRGRAGQLLDEGRADGVGEQRGRERFRPDRVGVEVGLRKKSAQGLDDFFPAAHPYQPVMHDGYPQVRKIIVHGSHYRPFRSLSLIRSVGIRRGPLRAGLS